jgi:hypothetical protein
MIIERLVLSLAALLVGAAAHGAECPDGKAAKKGFVLERPGIRSVFRPSPENVVQVTNSFDSSPPQTQFFLGGLIEVFRTSKTGQFAVLANSDLSAIFPLKEGAREKLKWLQLDAEQNTVEPRSLELRVAGKEKLKLGACDYDVLAVRQTFKDADGTELDTLTALYAPGLQAILAKRYDEGTDQEDTVAYTSIKPLVE